jgi:multiple antibiotic resistance protein
MDSSELLRFFTGVFMAFFAVMNPIANTPLFLALTPQSNSISRRRIARNSVLVAFCITTLFCLLGNKIFLVFGITLPAFKITGGLLITMIGFEALQGKQSRVQNPSMKAHEQSIESDLNVAVSPLGIPLLSGPGTITTAVNFVSDGSSLKTLITIGSFALLCLITYVCFLFSREIKKYLGQIGINVVTRLMGLILAVVGVEMLVTGIKSVFPALTGS